MATYVLISLLRQGSACRIYFNPKGGKPGIKYADGVPIDHSEFPMNWFEGLDEEFYLARRYLASRNKYGVCSHCALARGDMNLIKYGLSHRCKQQLTLIRLCCARPHLSVPGHLTALSAIVDA